MKLRHRLLLSLVAVATVAGVACSLGIVSLIRGSVRDAYLGNLRVRTQAIIHELESHAPSPDDVGILALQLGAAFNARVRLLDRQSRTIADSMTPGGSVAPGESADLSEAQDVIDARMRGWGLSEGTCDTEDEPCFLFTRRIEKPGPIGFLRVSVPVSRAESVPAQRLGAAVSLVAAAVLLMAAIAYAGLRSFSKPLEHITACAERLGEGQLDCSISHDGDDELAGMRRALMHLRAFMISKIDDVERSRRLLDSVIASMKEGVLVVDASGHIRLANNALRGILGLGKGSLAQRSLTDILRHPDLLSMIDEGIESGIEQHGRVEDLDRRGRTFEVEVSPLQHDGNDAPSGVVVLLFDVTRIDRLEKTRRDFVANVTHELRTPLTSVKAAAATLLGSELDDQATTRRFLETIDRHSERMAELVSDLADLSLIETGGIRLAPEMIDIGLMARDAVRQLEPKYAPLELEVECSFPDPLLAYVDRRRFEQVLVNLIDNGMKFNREHGALRVRGLAADPERGLGGPVITIEDTGRGIPQDALEKIFERFFRVEPGTSYERGTGLGLSIVRHLVNLHGGRIHTESELGKGTRFIIELPPPAD